MLPVSLPFNISKRYTWKVHRLRVSTRFFLRPDSCSTNCNFLCTRGHVSAAIRRSRPRYLDKSREEMRLARVICRIGWTRSWNGFSLLLLSSPRLGVRVYTTRWYISMRRIFPGLTDINFLFLSTGGDCYYFLIKRYRSVPRPHPREQMMWNGELTRRYAPCCPFPPPHPAHSSFYSSHYVVTIRLFYPLGQANHQSHVIRSIDRSQTMDAFLEIGRVKVHTDNSLLKGNGGRLVKNFDGKALPTMEYC